jgi:CubicO group peptidase (beta-lactamase class C family)
MILRTTAGPRTTPRAPACWFLLVALLAGICRAEVPDSGAAVPHPGAAALHSADGRLHGFDEVVTQAMSTWNVPGAAVAIVHDGRVVYVKGFGYRDRERKLPVTTDTLFAIGSVSKSFTSVLFGILNDEGKVSWDKPVRTYLPEFQLADPVATEQATALDLFSHRTGLPGLDTVWYTSNFSRADLVNRLRYVKSNKSFRSGFEYCNLMVMTMGYLEGRVAGASWEELVRDRILQPLGMTHSNFSVTDSRKTADFAQPYGLRHAAVVKVPFKNLDAIGPAGSINSNIEDMARYVMFQLGDGSYDGRKLVSRENLEVTHTGVTAMNELSDPMPGVGPMVTYALGWGEIAYRGHRMVTHSGGIDGFRSFVTLFPQDKLGIVVLTNLDNNLAANVIAYAAQDRLLNLPRESWNERYRQIRDRQKAQEAQQQKAALTAKSGTQPSHPLESFVGEYTHPGYGTVRVTQRGGELRIALNELGPLPWSRVHYDVFQIPLDEDPNFAGLRGQFYMNKAGDIDRIALPLEPTSPEDIVFTRACTPQSTC